MLSRRRPPDFMLFCSVLALLTFGLVMVFSASEVSAYYRYNGDIFYYFKKQLLWAAIGVGVMLLFQNYDFWKLRKYVWPTLVVSFILLILVLIPGVGKVVNGAQRWIDLGFTRFQPSEIIKLSLVLFVAHLAAVQRGAIRNVGRGLLPHLAVLAACCLLILAQPDLGTAMAAAGTVYIMLFAAGARGKHLTNLAILGVSAIGLAIALEPYRMSRFLAFMNPFADPKGAGYHIIQSLYAIGSGGFFGVGLGNGMQKHNYLPEQHTDFIFAVINEELGFVGGSLVILLFVLFVWRGLKVAITSPDPFGSMLAVGITSMVALQAVVNMGVVTGSLPITGITLPFISFGGSSLVFTLAGVGILLNISRHSTNRW
ncbi:MAG TPA: putative lipid II flippase FtsW [Bacillota bacterium]|nr:putative lipid II flippase FtsW [Bacillota bacterium]